MKKLIVRTVLLVMFLAIVAIGLVFFYLNTIVKSGVEKVGPMVTKTTVQVGGANISPFSGAGGLKDFVIGNPEGFKSAQAIQMGEVKLAVAPSSLLSDKIIVHSVQVISPKINYELGLGGSNLGKLLENIQSAVPQSASKPADNTGASKKIQLDDLVVSGGEIQVAASMLGGKSLTIPLPNIHLSNLGSGPDGITIAEVVSKVFSEIVNETAKAVASSSGMATGVAKDLGKGAIDKAKGIGDLFKKKP
jgi:hypothetical protein